MPDTTHLIATHDVGAEDQDGLVPRSAAPLIGRVAELQALQSAIDDARAGRASVIVVDGDAGVGKTRVLNELTAASVQRGVQLMVGHCVDLGSAPPPYLPFSEAFARLAGEQPDLIVELLTAHPQIARLLPRRESNGADDRIERGELFAAVLAAFAELARRQPVLLVIEDVHWADQASRDLLGFLFTRVGSEQFALVVSYRSDDLHRRHPLRPVVAEWARLPAVERIHLDPLPPEDVRTLVQAMHARPLGEADVASIVSRADGNPFFAEELISAAERCDDAQQLPWHLADLLLVRLDGLSDDGRRAVRVAAVAGRRVSHDVLVEVVDLPPERLDTALREAIEAHILELTPSGRGYTFRHALLAEAVYDDLLPGEVVRLHAAYAAVVASRGDRSAAELARHARLSRDYAMAYEASVRAGDEAMSVAAPQEALQHYETALDLRQRLPDPPDTADLLVSLADAAAAAGRAHRGYRFARAALDALDDNAPGETRGKLLYALAVVCIEGERDDEARGATTAALRLVPSAPSPLRARLAALHARLAMVFGLEMESEKWAREAIDIAARLGRPLASSDAETTLAMLQRRRSEPDEVAERLLHTAEQARLHGEPAAEIRSRYNLGSLYLEHGDLRAAEHAYLETWQRAGEVGRPWMLFGVESRALAATVQYEQGEWDAALDTLDLTGEQATPLARARLNAVRMMVLVGRGDPHALDAAGGLRQWWQRESLVANASVQATLDQYGWDGRADDAAALADEAVAVLSPMWQQEWFLGRIRFCALVVIACAAELGTASQTRRDTLVELAGRFVGEAHTAAEQGVPRGRGLGVEAVAWLARVEAEWARLRWLAGVNVPAPGEHLGAWQRAVDSFGYGNEAERARCRTRLAAVLRAAGCGAEAAAQADLARTAARAMGAVPLLAEIRALGTVPASKRAPGGLAALTDRERDVLGLLVAARTNRQIAAQLYISEKTVSVHVSNILAKLDVRSRAEAAALAHRAETGPTAPSQTATART